MATATKKKPAAKKLRVASSGITGGKNKAVKLSIIAQVRAGGSRNGSIDLFDFLADTFDDWKYDYDLRYMLKEEEITAEELELALKGA